MVRETSRQNPTEKPIDIIGINEINEDVSYLLIYKFLNLMFKTPYKKEILEIRDKLDKLFPAKEPLTKLEMVKFTINEETIKITNFFKSKDIRRINYKIVNTTMLNVTKVIHIVMCKGYDIFPRVGHILEYTVTYSTFYDESNEHASIESYNIFTKVVDYRDFLILYGFEALLSFHK